MVVIIVMVCKGGSVSVFVWRSLGLGRGVLVWGGCVFGDVGG